MGGFSRPEEELRVASHFVSLSNGKWSLRGCPCYSSDAVIAGGCGVVSGGSYTPNEPGNDKGRALKIDMSVCVLYGVRFAPSW